MIRNRSFRKNHYRPTFCHRFICHGICLSSLTFIRTVNGNIQVFEIGSKNGILENFTFPKKNEGRLRENRMQEKNIQIRSVVCDNDVGSMRQGCFFHDANAIKTKNAHQPTPNNEEFKADFFPLGIHD